MSGFTHYRVHADHQIPILSNTTQDRPSNPSRYNINESVIKNLRIEIISMTDDEIDFDLIGVDASIANALRRIMLAEVPTIAIENVWLAVNSSIIQDEVLAHRIGLVPIRADPDKLEFIGADGEETDKDTIVFHFDVECVDQLSGEVKRGRKCFVNEDALSGALTWLPQGNQAEVFSEGIAPVHNDIVLAKLRPGQRIEFEAHCRKGLGKDHTKFSPVATASYRLLPDIQITEPITGNAAVQLKAICPLQVFDIEDMIIGGRSTPTAVVSRPRDCTMCRECIRDTEKHPFGKQIELRRKADHFVFSVESSGCLPPVDIVRKAISVLADKARKFQRLAEEVENQL